MEVENTILEIKSVEKNWAQVGAWIRTTTWRCKPFSPTNSAMGFPNKFQVSQVFQVFQLKHKRSLAQHRFGPDPIAVNIVFVIHC